MMIFVDTFTYLSIIMRASMRKFDSEDDKRDPRRPGTVAVNATVDAISNNVHT